MKVNTVAVIGAGIMGHGIAQVTAMAGVQARLNDISDDLLRKAQTQIEASLDRGVEKAKIRAADKADILARIAFTSDLPAAVAKADLVIEAAPERIDLKKELFRQFDRHTRPEAILASNTSQYSITEIAAAVGDPSRVIGMHWFNPPVAMKLIEIVRGLDTADETVVTLRAFAETIGKEVVVCGDSQGFISTRLLLALRLECYRLHEEGLASKEDIDKTLRLAFGHPMGQFELADFSGLDIEISACEALQRVFGDRFRAPQSLRHKVVSGRLGRKSGQGWYTY
jgi:3-hydroxybutyryl-CoA dehydrogenase